MGKHYIPRCINNDLILLIDGIENMEALITRKYGREGRVKVIRVKRKRDCWRG